MTQSEHPLQAALGRLADLVAPADAGAVSELQRRQAARAFRVLVVGEAKRGKSTLVNALIGRSLLPTGVVPLTAVATTLCYGRPERVTVSYRTGGREVVALSRLDELVTEAGNPGNARGVDDVTVHLDVGLLSRGLELVDTPGTGSVHENNTAQAVAALAGMDAAIFVLSADPPISASERLWLREVRGQAVHVFCVLNKADYLAPADLVETLAFTRRVLAEELGTDLPAWPVSARLALGGGDASAGGDWDAFVDAFTGYLTNKQSSELDRSVASRAARLAAGVADQATASLAALSLSQQDLDQRVDQFRLQVEQVQQDRFASAALLSAGITRLKKQTDTEAAAVAQRAGQTLSRAVAARLGELRGPPAHVERQALAFAGEQIQGVVDGWRTGRATALDEAVHALDHQLGERLTEHVSAVRQAASTLFKMELGQLAGSGRLVASRRFAYSFGADVGQTEAAAAAVRARLPGAFGRRRVTRHVLRRATELLDRHVGRAQADLRERLSQTQRGMLRELDLRFDAGAGWIAGTLQDAVALRAGQSAPLESARASAAARRDAAHALGRELQEHGDPGRLKPLDNLPAGPGTQGCAAPLGQ